MAPVDHEFLFALSARVFSIYARDPDRALVAMLRQPGAIAFVALRGETKVGFVVLSLRALGHPFGPWPNPARAHVDAIAVAPEEHGAGIGRRLFDHAASAAREAGAVSMSLTTAETNTAALGLFRAAGMWELYVERDAYRGGQSGRMLFKGL